MGVITELNESGSEISAADIGKVVYKITGELKEGDVAVLTGSLPAGCEKDVYAKLIAALNKKNVKCVLDADGEALVLGVKEKPYFIKPNIDELGALLGQKIEDTHEALVAAGSRLLAQGISVVGISLGGKGSFLMNAEKVLLMNSSVSTKESLLLMFSINEIR
jgi:1-phosphofructokinase